MSEMLPLYERIIIMQKRVLALQKRKDARVIVRRTDPLMSALLCLNDAVRELSWGASE